MRQTNDRESKGKVSKVSRRTKLIIALIAIVAFRGPVEAGDPPLPLHSIEGTSGVLVTSTAYLANPPEEGQTWGLPSFSATGVMGQEKDLQSFAVTENLLGRFELGYAYERLGLGDWHDDVKAATGLLTLNHLNMHVFNARAMVIEENAWDYPWLPAVTVGAHYKWAEDRDDLNNDLNGLLDTLGSDEDYGVDFTLVGSKTITDLLPRPVIVSAGLRNSDAIHTGFFGFAGERRTTLEGSVIAFLTDKLAIAGEYRQKPSLLNQLGPDLIKAENDWWTLALAYVVNDNLTISGGYLNLGNVGNHQEDNCWGLQLKFEF